MIHLTDDDREAIKLEMYAHDAPEALYLAGMIAGLERAAKVCEEVTWIEERHDKWHEGYNDACEACADAIRALGKP